MNLNHDQLMKIGKAWADGLIEGLGNNSTEVNRENDDLISRRVAIDVVANWFKKIELNGDICLDGLRSLPSAEPEIIRCKDCKWKQGSVCVRFADVYPFADDFCSRAERKTDE